MAVRFFATGMNRGKYIMSTNKKGKINKERNMSRKKGQSILEYILVAVVFATVGVGTFIASGHVLVKEHRGLEDNYHSQDTLIGQVLQDDYSKQSPWPGEQEWQKNTVAQKTPQDTDGGFEDGQENEDDGQWLDEDQWGEVISEGLGKIEKSESGE